MRHCGGRVRGTVAWLLCAAAAMPVGAQRHERKRMERAEILQMEESWREAQLADDIGTMDRLLSEEFVGVTASGQVVTKLQQLDRMRSRRLDMKKLTLSDAKVKISGNLAVVTSLAQMDGTADGAPLQGAFRYTRVYQRLPGGEWKITNFEATRVGDRAGLGPAPHASAGVPHAGVPSLIPASQAGRGSPRPPS